MTALLLGALGLVLLTAGADLLVRGASRLASLAGLSPLVVGLTVVAFGTSSPELGASVAAALNGRGDLAVGNVVGSNILNVLVILGATAILAPVGVASPLVRVDVPLMVGATALAWALAADGTLGRVEGSLLVAGLVGYLAFRLRRARREPDAPARGMAAPVAAPPIGRAGLPASLATSLAGLALLVGGAHWLVEGATGLARMLGVTELVIGLTLVAAGTSLPETATSLVAAWRGERDIAVGNVIGSNAFNLLGVLGLSGVVAPGGLAVSAQVLALDAPVMMAAALVCVPVVATGFLVTRREGLLLVGYYAMYVGFLVLSATGHAALEPYTWIAVVVVLPLTLAALALASFRAARVAARRRVART